jgi:hypothetical protein
MKRYIVVAIIAVLLVGCTPNPSPVVDTSATVVAATIAAWEFSIAPPQPQQQISTPITTLTPYPTALVEVTPTYTLGYCNETWARLVVSQLKDIDEPAKEDGQEIPSLDGGSPLTDAQRMLILAATEIRIAKIKLLPVPPCLEKAKELKLYSYESLKQLFSGSIPEDEVFGTLIAAGTASQEADAEIAKIETCIQTGCNQ